MRALPGGEGRIVCSLSRGELEVDGYLWDRAGMSVCKPWHFHADQAFTSVSLLRYHGQPLAFKPEWDPKKETRNLPSHNQWNMYFESDVHGSSNYFVYSALVDDVFWGWQRWAFKEILLMMNWRIVTTESAPLETRAFSQWLAVRRLPPLALLSLAVALAAAVVSGFKCWRKRKCD